MVRAFVALELSDEIKQQLASAQQTLRGCRSRFTFVEPKNIHITAKFLGEVEERELPEIVAALHTITSVPFQVTAGKVTVNDPRRPHTVWCTIEDSGEIEKVFHHIENVLEPLGFPRERRPFTPHATIARVKLSDQSLFSALTTLDKAAYGSCTIHGITLKKSTLLPSGPVYEDLLVLEW